MVVIIGNLSNSICRQFHSVVSKASRLRESGGRPLSLSRPGLYQKQLSDPKESSDDNVFSHLRCELAASTSPFPSMAYHQTSSGGPPTSVSNSSLNYSQYAYSSFGDPQRQPPLPSSSSSAMSAPQRSVSGGYSDQQQSYGQGKVGLGLSVEANGSGGGGGGDPRRRGSQRQQQGSSTAAEQEVKRVAQVHYDALRRFLRVSLEQGESCTVKTSKGCAKESSRLTALALSQRLSATVRLRGTNSHA